MKKQNFQSHIGGAEPSKLRHCSGNIYLRSFACICGSKFWLFLTRYRGQPRTENPAGFRMRLPIAYPGSFRNNLGLF